MLTITVPGTEKPKAVPEGINHPRTFLAVANFIAQVAEDEILFGDDPIFTDYKEDGEKFTADIKEQVAGYALGHYPFNDPLKPGQSVLEWWERLRGTTNAGLLAVS